MKTLSVREYILIFNLHIECVDSKPHILRVNIMETTIFCLYLVLIIGKKVVIVGSLLLKMNDRPTIVGILAH